MLNSRMTWVRFRPPSNQLCNNWTPGTTCIWSLMIFCTTSTTTSVTRQRGILCSCPSSDSCFLLTTAEIGNVGSMHAIKNQTPEELGEVHLYHTLWLCWDVFSPSEFSRHKSRKEGICKRHTFKNSQMESIYSIQKHQSICFVTFQDGTKAP